MSLDQSSLGSQWLLWAVLRHSANRQIKSIPVSMDSVSEEQMNRVICRPLLMTCQNQSQKMDHKSPDVALDLEPTVLQQSKGKVKYILQLNSGGVDPGFSQGWSERKERLFPAKQWVLSARGSYPVQGSVPELGWGWPRLDLKSVKMVGISALTLLGWSSVCKKNCSTNKMGMERMELMNKRQDIIDQLLHWNAVSELSLFSWMNNEVAMF